jgi:hypothetical protein
MKASTNFNFDTHELIKKLVSSDLPEKQAVAIINAIKKSHQSYAEMVVSKSELQSIKNEIQKLELRMTIKIGAMITGATATIMALFKFI